MTGDDTRLSDGRNQCWRAALLNSLQVDCICDDKLGRCAEASKTVYRAWSVWCGEDMGCCISLTRMNPRNTSRERAQSLQRGCEPPIASTKPSVVQAIHRLPMQTVRSESEVSRWKVDVLLRELRHFRKQPARSVCERNELVTLVLRVRSTPPECFVCMEPIRYNDVLRVLHCLHRAHIECLDRFLLQHEPTCPVCRQPVLLHRE